jgi:hypothetical protein
MDNKYYKKYFKYKTKYINLKNHQIGGSNIKQYTIDEVLNLKNNDSILYNNIKKLLNDNCNSEGFNCDMDFLKQWRNKEKII